jgi:uncharacterized membrane protein
MSLAIFDMNGLHFLLRWIHIYFGLIWIGLLYYFNFVQGPFFNETDAATKSNATQKLVPRALWWFRYGALWTILSGLAMVTITGMQGGHEVFKTAYGVTILIGMSLGTVMFLNVWLVIWPNQKIVIANAVDTAQGKAANPAAAGAAAKAFLASRTNTMFSVPMLFFMVGARHIGIAVDSETYKFGLCFGLFFLILIALEFNALKGKPGPLQKVSGVITAGFVLTAVLYLLTEICK